MPVQHINIFQFLGLPSILTLELLEPLPWLPAEVPASCDQ